MGDAALTGRVSAPPLRSKRVLALAGDDRLVERIRRGDELAFEVAFERHGGGILGFCRHMLGSPEEAEDAVQQTFAAALRDIQRRGERRIALKPWLYTIARNRCLSVLRTRREHVGELQDLPTEGLDEQVERRLELRELLADLHELPEEQRAALLLAEADGLSHAEVAGVLGCEVARVKALVFRARSGLIDRRAARETSCAEIRKQLANLRGGSLRRSELRHHLRRCPGCAEYREEVRRQRQLLAAALPVMPTMGLKSSVLAAVGIGGGAAGGGGAAAAGIGGLGPAIASLVSGTAAKVAVVAVVGGSVAAGGVAVERATEPDGREAPSAHAPPHAPVDAGAGAGAEARPNGVAGAQGERMSAERSHGGRGAEARLLGRSRQAGRGRAGLDRSRASDGAGGRTHGQAKRSAKGPAEPRGRGPADARGPAETRGRAGTGGQGGGSQNSATRSGGQAKGGGGRTQSGTKSIPGQSGTAMKPKAKQPPVPSPKVPPAE